MKITYVHLSMSKRQEGQFDTKLVGAVPIQRNATMEQLSAIISRVRPRNAHGEDGIPLELHAAAGDVLAPKF